MYDTINLMYGCETMQDFTGAACGRDADNSELCHCCLQCDAVQTTWHHISEDGILRNCFCENCTSVQLINQL